MTEENKTNEAAVVSTPVENTSTENAAPKKFERNFGGKRFGGGKPFDKKGGRGGKGGRFEKPKAEFEQKMIDIRRVTRVVSGGRRFSYSVSLVVGDRKGHVGFGIGKSIDTSMAIDKAYRAALKKMVTLRLNKNFSIPYEVKAKFNASKISLMPNKGRGLIAGSSARVILALAGVKDVTAKYNSPSKNKLNNAKVAMEALSAFSIPFERSHKPKEDRTEGVRKFVGRGDRGDGKKFGGRPGGFRKPFVKRDDTPRAENKIDKITL
jgi:small subunit ribosomal protein S5